jgi:hypothetical protein
MLILSVDPDLTLRRLKPLCPESVSNRDWSEAVVLRGVGRGRLTRPLCASLIIMGCKWKREIMADYQQLEPGMRAFPGDLASHPAPPLSQLSRRLQEDGITA